MYEVVRWGVFCYYFDVVDRGGERGDGEQQGEAQRRESGGAGWSWALPPHYLRKVRFLEELAPDLGCGGGRFVSAFPFWSPLEVYS